MPSSPTATSPMTSGSRSAIPSFRARILAGASAQLRNMASTGGNLLQRTRCLYFYDTTPRAISASRAQAASAIGRLQPHERDSGLERDLHCRASFRSCAWRSRALEAMVHVSGPKGDRAIPFADFHRLPGDTPEIDTNLARDEIIIAIELPPEGFSSQLQLSEDQGSPVLCFRLGFCRRRSQD